MVVLNVSSSFYRAFVMAFVTRPRSQKIRRQFIAFFHFTLRNKYPYSMPLSSINMLHYRFSLAFLCVVNIGVRRIEQTRRRVIQAGALNVVGCILEALLASKGFSVGPSSNVSGVPRETREQHARELAAIEKEEVVVLTKALQHTQKSAAQRPPRN